MVSNPLKLAPPEKISKPATATKSFEPPNAMNGGALPSIHKNMGDQMQIARMQLDKITHAKKMLGVADEEFTNLSMLSDMITSEDVTEAAANLVAHGAKAHDIASLLSTMPPSGQALADWVKQHMMDTQKMMQQVEQAEELVRHQLGVASLRHLAAHHLEPQEAPGGEQDSNSLTLGKGQLAPGSGPAMPSQPNLEGMEPQGNA